MEKYASDENKVPLLPGEKEFYNYLLNDGKKELKELICGKPDVLRKYIGEIEKQKIFVLKRVFLYTSGYSIIKEERELNSKLDKIIELKEAVLDDLKLTINEVGKEYNLIKDLKSKKSKKKELLKKVGIKSQELYNPLEKRLKKIFDYDTFCKEGPKGEWGPYQLVDSLEVPVCPYCNRQYTSIYFTEAEKGQFRPQLDHFFAKAIYPYTALSFYNLIPCCCLCNSPSLKGTKDFYKPPHLNPYEGEFGDVARFKITPKESEKKYDLEVYYGNSDNFDIKIDVLKEDKKKDIAEKVDNNKKVFKLQEQYESHKDYVRELILKSIIYDKDYVEDLVALFNGRLDENQLTEREDANLILGDYTNNDNIGKKQLAKFSSRQGENWLTEKEVINLVLGNYTDDDNMGKRPLAKLTKDVTEQFGFNKRKNGSLLDKLNKLDLR